MRVIYATTYFQIRNFTNIELFLHEYIKLVSELVLVVVWAGSR